MNVFIIGSGRTGSELAKMLSMDSHNVVVIDTDPDAFKKLGAAFNGLQVVGSGTDEILLREVKAQEADIFAALTDKDNINIMAAQVAKNIFHIPKVIAKINDPLREKAFRGQDFCIVSGTHLISASIWNEISQKPYKFCCDIAPDTRIIRFIATEAIAGQLVSQLNAGADFIICAVMCKGKYYLALPNLEINLGDEIIAIAKTGFLDNLEEML